MSNAPRSSSLKALCFVAVCLGLFVIYIWTVPTNRDVKKFLDGGSSGSSSGGGSYNGTSRDSRTVEAWTMAQLFLEDHLKSPSTASYGWQTSDDCVTNLGDGVYQVKGWVDSQNGFGATVRMKFVVKVKDAGDGNTWSLVGKPIMAQR